MLGTLSVNHHSCCLRPRRKEESFDWILGKWERTNEKPDKQTFESWQKINDKQYNGLGYTMQGKDTIWKENIRLNKGKRSLEF